MRFIRHPLVLPGLAIAAVGLGEAGLSAGDFSLASHAVQIVFAALICAPLALAYRRPALGLAATGVAIGLEAALIPPPQVFAEGITASILCFAAGARSDRRWLIVSYTVFLAGGLLRDLRDPLYDSGDTLADGFIFSLILTTGLAMRVYLRRSVRLAGEANAARNALTQERGRIARELHDIVAHSVSVMVVQATSARPRATDDESREAFAAIETAGRQALVELRRLLGVLRTPDDAPTLLAPQPGLDDIRDLVNRVRAVGQPVELHVEGTGEGLSPGVELSAYRVVQEGLTNAVKHAAGARTVVRISRDQRDLVIEVRDGGGDRTDTAGSGHGLAGLRERIDLYDGRLESGTDGRGFLLRATLPTGAGR